MSESPERSMTTPQEWYAEGLRFSCTQCGNCCTGPPGAVWFTREEGAAIAADLGIAEQRFYDECAHQIHGRWSLKERQVDGSFDCVFLDRSSSPGKAVCSIYKSRPTQCRTWPFWPENLVSRRIWETVKRRTPCPGMNVGKIVPIEQIRIQRDQHCGQE